MLRLKRTAIKFTRRGIYLIENLEGVYIGSSEDIDKRWDNHLRKMREGIHSNRELQRIYDRDGRASFKFSVLQEVPIGQDLIEAEEYYWRYYMKSGIRVFNRVSPKRSRKMRRPHQKLKRKRKKKRKPVDEITNPDELMNTVSEEIEELLLLHARIEQLLERVQEYWEPGFLSHGERTQYAHPSNSRGGARSYTSPKSYEIIEALVDLQSATELDEVERLISYLSGALRL